MELPTYTSIWRIEKRLYKLYDFRLPMPVPVGQIAVFTAITVPYVVLLTVLGLPFNHTLFWLYVLPPGVLTWLATRPVLESKRLPELLISQIRYLGEPGIWCRMAPLAEKDEVAVVGRVWRRQADLDRASDPEPEPGRQVAPTRHPAVAGQRALPVTASRAQAAPPEWVVPRPAPASRPAPAAGYAVVPARPAAGSVPGRVRVPAPARPAGPSGPLSGSESGPLPPAPAVPPWPVSPAVTPAVRAQGFAEAAAAPPVPPTGKVAVPQAVIAPSEVVTSAGGIAPARPALVPPPVASRVPPSDADGIRTAAAALPDVLPPEVAHDDQAEYPAAAVLPLVAPPRRAEPGEGRPADVARRDEEAVSGGAAPVTREPAAPGAGKERRDVRGGPPDVSAGPPDVSAGPPDVSAGPPDVHGEPGARADDPGDPRAAAAADADADPADADADDGDDAGDRGAEPPSASPWSPPVVVVRGNSRNRPTAVERALGGPGPHRGGTTAWRVPVRVIPGGHGPGRPDMERRDRERVMLPIEGPRLTVVLGCTVGAGQTVTTLMLADVLASLRGEAVAALDLNPGSSSLSGLARTSPAATARGLLAGEPPAVTAPPGRGRLDVIAHDAMLDGRPDLSDADYGRIAAILASRYTLTLADPGAMAVARLLAAADLLVLVAPASADASRAVAMTMEWLDGNGHADLCTTSIAVINGVSKRSMSHVEQAELVVRGRCRAIVRVPWDDHLAEPPAEPGSRGPRPVSATPASGFGQLRPPVQHAYTALAGVLVAALATASGPQRRASR